MASRLLPSAMSCCTSELRSAELLPDDDWVLPDCETWVALAVLAEAVVLAACRDR